jgi:hypothetical protein
MADGVYPKARAAAVIDPSEAKLAIACKPEMLTVTSLSSSWDPSVITARLSAWYGSHREVAGRLAILCRHGQDRRWVLTG